MVHESRFLEDLGVRHHHIFGEGDGEYTLRYAETSTVLRVVSLVLISSQDTFWPTGEVEADFKK